MDIEHQVVVEVKKSPYFAIQLDESTDVSNCDILLCFVRYKGKTDFKEKLLCYIDLPGRTTGSEIFRLLNTYFNEKNIVSVSNSRRFWFGFTSLNFFHLHRNRLFVFTLQFVANSKNCNVFHRTFFFFFLCMT